MVENTESGDDVEFAIQGREYFGPLQSVTTERGFVVASYPDPEISDSSAEVIVVSGQGDEFEHSLRLSSQMRQVYYRAYAVNAEGVAYGSTRYLKIDDNAYSPGWVNASPLLGADGWWTSPWFGEFYVGDDSGWLTHGELGWLFTMGEHTNGIWIWREKLGWMWTNSINLSVPLSAMIRTTGYFSMARAVDLSSFTITGQITGCPWISINFSRSSSAAGDHSGW